MKFTHFSYWKIRLIHKKYDLRNPIEHCYFVLCCDGVWDFVDENTVAQLVQNEVDPRAAALKVRDHAYNTGSNDNITAIVMRFGSERFFGEHEKLSASIEKKWRL